MFDECLAAVPNNKHSSNTTNKIIQKKMNHSIDNITSTTTPDFDDHNYNDDDNIVVHTKTQDIDHDDNNNHQDDDDNDNEYHSCTKRDNDKSISTDDDDGITTNKFQRRISHTPSILSFVSESRNNDVDGMNEYQQQLLTYKETRAVHYLKLTMIIMLLIIAAIVCYVIYQYSSTSEVNEFTLQFQYTSSQIMNKLHTNAKTKMEAIQSIALLLQTYAINTNETWPFVTLPFYENHIRATESLLGAYGVLLFPIVTTENRKAWENYTYKHRNWINDSYDTQQMLNHGYYNNRPILTGTNATWVDLLWLETDQTPNMPNFEIGGGIADSIFSTAGNIDEKPLKEMIDGPYYPQWQAAPISAYYQSTINLNYGRYDDFNQSAIIAMNGSAVLGYDWQDYLSPGRITTILYPVFNSFDIVTRNVVAFLGIDVYWESYLEGILPNHTSGIYVVIENTCNKTFSFSLNGPDAKFLGIGDNHSTEYNHMKVTTVFGEYLKKEYIEELEYIHDNTDHDHHSDNSVHDILLTEDTTKQHSITSYNGVPLNSDVCQYTFHIYPTEEMQQKYITNKPVLYTAVVGLVFIFTILVFVLYDCFVEKRQRILVNSAEKSDAIVSSLFPKSVKDRLYSETNATKTKTNNKNGKHSNYPYNNNNSSLELADDENDLAITNHSDINDNSNRPMNRASQICSMHYDSIVGNNQNKNNKKKMSNSRISNNNNNNNNNNNLRTSATNSTIIMTSEMDESTNNNETMNMSNNTILGVECSPTNNNTTTRGGKPNNILNGKAIAESYPETTILFADIAGFTQWSSGRNPVDVFFLLETIYSAFDKIANRRKVFKVETIGDCYVAVTGIPRPQSDHAIRITKFANEMLKRLPEELHRIVPVLGTDTLNLAMRVGLHSGAVIAGVLRGEKARFQLFGDTMNTASRMESNGLKNRIHVSEATAHLLRASGKQSWLTQREDMIEAKGKGLLQTYWVEIHDDNSSRRSSRSSLRQRSMDGLTFDENIQKIDCSARSSSHRDIEDVTEATDYTPSSPSSPKDIVFTSPGSWANKNQKIRHHKDLNSKGQFKSILGSTLELENGSSHSIYFVDEKPIDIDHGIQNLENSVIMKSIK